MKAVALIRKQFRTAVICLSGMSAIFPFMPMASELAEKTGNWTIRLTGIAFWILAIAGYGSVIRANRNRKQFLKRKFGRDIQCNFRPGFLCFWSNPVAKTVDLWMAVMTVALGITMAGFSGNAVIVLSVFALWFWSVNMHSLLNGRIYRITKYDLKERKKV